MKKLVRILALLLCAAVLSGCCMQHEWGQASCEEPASCAKCGETLGDELGHHPGEWETVSLPMWGEEGLRRRVCLICGSEVEKEAVTLEPSFNDEPFHMDIHTMLARVEAVLKPVSEDYDCVLTGHPDVGLSLYIFLQEDVVGILTFGVEGYYMSDDKDLPDETELIASLEYLEDDQVLENVVLAFVACFDPTVSRENAGPLTEEIRSFIRNAQEGDQKIFSSTGIDFEVVSYSGVFCISPEKKA